jgi:predicted transcriptional regulator
MKQLTRAEEEVMQILWRLENAYVRDILEEFPDPKPAYNTVSTITRILEKKGFVGYNPKGKSHEYFPVIDKKSYRRSYFKGFIKNYFGNSYLALTSFFSKEADLSIKELEELKSLIDDEIKRKSSDE